MGIMGHCRGEKRRKKDETSETEKISADYDFMRQECGGGLRRGGGGEGGRKEAGRGRMRRTMMDWTERGSSSLRGRRLLWEKGQRSET